MAYSKLITRHSIEQRKAVFSRAAIVAAVLGTVLTVVNQPGAIFGPTDLQWLPLFLAYLTPLVIICASQVMGAQAAARVKGWQGEKYERFLMTLFSHGIIRRAAVLGIAIGAVNIAIINAGRQLDQLSVAQLLQLVTLPVLFGALSQSLSFRRAVGSPNVLSLLTMVHLFL